MLRKSHFVSGYRIPLLWLGLVLATLSPSQNTGIRVHQSSPLSPFLFIVVLDTIDHYIEYGLYSQNQPPWPMKSSDPLEPTDVE